LCKNITLGNSSARKSIKKSINIDFVVWGSFDGSDLQYIGNITFCATLATKYRRSEPITGYFVPQQCIPKEIICSDNDPVDRISKKRKLEDESIYRPENSTKFEQFFEELEDILPETPISKLIDDGLDFLEVLDNETREAILSAFTENIGLSIDKIITE
jgi:hypothetical protein